MHLFGSYSFNNKSYSFNNKKCNGKEELRKLRNLAMHGKNPVGQDSQTSIYSIDSFKYFLFGLKVLRVEYAKILSSIYKHADFIRSIELENRSKLDIIHIHHPKALEYFLG